MLSKLPLLLTILLVGCAQTEFDATPAGSEQPVRVENSQDVQFPGDPLVYRMRADEGHLVFWIDNPTNQPVELLGDKSDVTDPEGVAHHLRGRTIAPLSSIKEIFPPMMDQTEGPPPGPAEAVSPYDRPGFIAVPDIQSGSRDNDQNWQWDDELDIHLNLFFDQDGHQFEQHFSIRRLRK
jgi:hypothetical protein